MANNKIARWAAAVILAIALGMIHVTAQPPAGGTMTTPSGVNITRPTPPGLNATAPPGLNATMPPGRNMTRPGRQARMGMPPAFNVTGPGANMTRPGNMTGGPGNATANIPGHAQGRPGQDDCICPMVYAPVCGADGVTYSNSCQAMCAGVAVAKETGPC